MGSMFGIDPVVWAAILGELLKKKPQIILCACLDYRQCHRLTVAEFIAVAFGVEIVHWDPTRKKHDDQLFLL